MLSISRASCGSIGDCCAGAAVQVQASVRASRTERKLMRNSLRDAALVDAADEAFEVTGLGQRENLRVVGRSGAGFEELNTAAGIGGCGADDLSEVGQRDVMRAGAGDERAAGCEQTDRTKVQFLVAAESALGRPLGLCEG